MNSTLSTKPKKNIFNKILKWFGITFFTLVLAILILPYIFKDELIQLAKVEANKNLNAEVNFGQFDLTLFSSFPNFRFKIDSISIVGIDEFKNDTLAYIKHTELDVDLLSIINGEKYKVEQILLEEPRIYAKVLANAKANWDIVKTSADTTIVSDTSSTKFKLSLSKLEIKKATICYDDETMNMKTSLIDVDFKLKGDFTQDNFIMSISSEIQKLNFNYEGIPYAKNIHSNMNIVMDMDLPKMKFTFKENDFTFNSLQIGIDGFIAMPAEDIDMDMQFSCKQTEFKSILSLIPAVYSKDFESVTTTGKLLLNGFVKGIYNEKTMPGFGAHLEVANAMFKYPSLPKSVNNINVNIDIQNPNGNPDATTIDINKFHVEMASNPLDVAMHVKTPISNPSINGEVKGKIDLASVKEFIPMEAGDELNGVIAADVKLNGKMSMITDKKYEQFKAQGTVEVEKMNYKSTSVPYSILINTMKLNFTPQFVELVSFDAKMGKSDIKATGKIEDFLQYVFKDSLIKGNFNMSANLIDLNELMTATSTDTVAAKTIADSSAMSVVLIPKNIDFVLNSSIGKLLYDKLEIDNVVGAIVVKDARVSMQNLKLNLLDGSMIMSGFYETKNIKQPALNFNLTISDFDIQKTFNAFNSVKKLAPIGKYTKGKFSTTLNNLVGTINEKMDLEMQSLTGNGNLKTTAVSVEGFEPFVKIGDALKMDKLKKMDFQNINLFYVFKDGRVTINPFKTKIQNIEAEISGSTGFDQTIDYKWNLLVPTKELPSQAVDVVKGFLGKASALTGQTATFPDKVDITVLIGGTILKPVIKTGMKNMMKDIKNEIKEDIKKVIEEKKEEIIKDIKAEVNKQAEKLLADAQTETDKIKAEAASIATQIRTEGGKKAEELQSSGSNFFEKAANKKIAEKLKQEADKKAQKVVDEANSKADKIMEAAKVQGEKLKTQ